MTSHHQFSISLFNKLFKNNMVRSDGYIKATDAQLIQFRKLLAQEAAQKTAARYKKRKEMVDEVLFLLQEGELSTSGRKRLITLLHKLNMKVAEDGTLQAIPRSITGKRNSDSSELLGTETAFEREMETDETTIIDTKHDVMELNDLLEKISNPTEETNVKDSKSGDCLQIECSKKKLSKNQTGVGSKKSAVTGQKDKTSKRVTVKNIVAKAKHLSKQEDLKNFNSEEKLALESYPQELPDFLPPNEQSKRRAAKTVLTESKVLDARDATEDSIRRECVEEGSYPVALGEADSNQGICEMNSNWEKNIRSSVFGTKISEKARKKRKEFLTHVHEVVKASSADFQAQEEEALADLLKIFSKLMELEHEDEKTEFSEGSYESDEGTVEEEVVLYTKKGSAFLAKYGKSDKMAEVLFPSEIEPSLDEMKPEHEDEKTEFNEGFYESDEGTVEGGTVLYTKKGSDSLDKYGKSDKMAEVLFPPEMELSLDEILRKEEEERSHGKRRSKNEQLEGIEI